MYFTKNIYKVRLAQALKSFESYKGECNTIMERFLQGILCGIGTGIPAGTGSSYLSVDANTRTLYVKVPSTIFDELESCQMVFFLQMAFIKVGFEVMGCVSGEG